MEVYLDLDLTLVNVFPIWTTHWNAQIARHIGRDNAEVFRAGEAIWQRDDLYTLEGHLTQMGIDPRADWAVGLANALRARMRAGEANYRDTPSFLDALARHRIRPSIVTFGDEGFQGLKIEGLQRKDGFFHEVHFTQAPGEKGEILRRALARGPVTFIDDSARELARVAQVAPAARRIQIRRTPDIPVAPEAHIIVSDLMTALDALR